MSVRGLCWCGLGKGEHDGREMDAAGDMHRFNEAPRDEVEETPAAFEETRPVRVGPASLGRVTLPADDPQPRIYVTGLLRRVKDFLNLSIVKQEYGGAVVTANAERLSEEISAVLLRGF